MKKLGLLLIWMVLVAVAMGVLAQDEIELLGGADMDNSLILSNDQFGRMIVGNYENDVSSPKYWQLEGWYKITVPNSGTCTIRVKEYEDRMSWFRLRDHNGEIIESECYGGWNSGVWGVFTFDVKAGENYYLSFESNGGQRRWGYRFSVCIGGIHCLENEERVIMPASCTEQGSKGYKCEFCGEYVISCMIPEKGHQPGNEVIIQDATCLKKGVKGIRCNVCSEVISSKEIPEAKHIPGTYIDVRAATCTAEGIRTQYCQTCNATINTETVTALGHAPQEWQRIQIESCKHVGVREKRCAVCDAVLAVEEIPMKGHQYSKWETSVEPTKEIEGKQVRFCTYCGEEQIEIIPKIEKFMGIF